MSLDKDTLNELRIDRSAPARRGPSAALVWSALIVVAVVAGIIWWINRPKPVPVRTIVVQQPAGGGGGTSLLNASGYVTPRREATVSSKVTGKVVEVLVEEGMKVEADQVLARIDSSNAEKSLRLAEAQAESARKALNETRVNLARAERELRRTDQLAATGIASPSDFDRVEAEAKTLTARLDRQQADVVVAEHEVE